MATLVEVAASGFLKEDRQVTAHTARQLHEIIFKKLYRLGRKSCLCQIRVWRKCNSCLELVFILLKVVEFDTGEPGFMSCASSVLFRLQ